MRERISVTLMLMVAMMLCFCGCGEQKDDIAVKDVKVYTTVTPGGQFPDRLEIELTKDCIEDVSHSDFEMKGKASSWLDSQKHDFTATFSAAKVEGNKLILTFDGFQDKYFFVDSWVVSNSKNTELSFSSEQVSEVITPVADEFVYHSTKEGEGFDYQLYTPADTSRPLPIVVVFHGYGDTHNLRAYRTSVAWAEPEAQSKRPCYVLSPIIGDDKYFEGKEREKVFESVHQKLQEMIDAGQVDRNRVYMMGNSFGGMSTVEYMEQYPDTIAGALALCSALNYSETAKEKLGVLKDSAIWIAQAENDGTIPSENSKIMYEELIKTGNNKVKMTIYSDDEMNRVGASPDNDSTFSYHHVEMAVMEDENYAQWLFNQTLKW